MDNNLNDQITENSEGEEKSPSSYTDPNAGYTEAEPQAKNDNSVPKEAADDNLKQEEKSHPAYTYGEMPKSENGSGYGQSAPGGSACHSGTSDGTYENNTYNGNSYYNGTNQSGAWILTLIVGIIPCAGLILYIIWAFGNSGNLNRRNYCRASLILQVISYVLVIFFVIIAAIGRVSYYGY